MSAPHQGCVKAPTAQILAHCSVARSPVFGMTLRVESLVAAIAAKSCVRRSRSRVFAQPPPLTEVRESAIGRPAAPSDGSSPPPRTRSSVVHSLADAPAATSMPSFLVGANEVMWMVSPYADGSVRLGAAGDASEKPETRCEHSPPTPAGPGDPPFHRHPLSRSSPT